MSSLMFSKGDTADAYPVETQNVVIANPKVRRVVTGAMSITGIAIACTIAGDSVSDVFDLTAWTIPASAVYGTLAGFIGIGVTLPNTPR